jgi:hypothetical protein
LGEGGERGEGGVKGLVDEVDLLEGEGREAGGLDDVVVVCLDGGEGEMGEGGEGRNPGGEFWKVGDREGVEVGEGGGEVMEGAGGEGDRELGEGGEEGQVFIEEAHGGGRMIREGGEGGGEDGVGVQEGKGGSEVV